MQPVCKKRRINRNINENKEAEENKSITFNELAKDLQIHCFQFLKEVDLRQIQQTSCSLRASCKDPNSLYYLDISHSKNEPNLNYQNKWYSRVKRLELHFYDNPNKQIQLNTNWSTSLIYLRSTWYANDVEISLHFNNLQKAILCCKSSSLLIDNINLINLYHLELLLCILNEALLTALLNCINIKTLNLRLIKFHSDLDFSINNIPYPFTKLTHLEIEDETFTYSKLYHFILSGGLSKTLHLNALTQQHPLELFSCKSKMGLFALKNISQIVLELRHGTKTNLLMKNILECWSILLKKNNTLKLEKFEMKIYSSHSGKNYTIKWFEWMCSILLYCNYCKLTVSFDIFGEMDNKWFLHILQCDLNQFELIVFDLELEIISLDDYDIYDFLIENATKHHILKQKGKEIAFLLMNEYDKYCIPLLMMKHKITTSIRLNIESTYWFRGMIVDEECFCSFFKDGLYDEHYNIIDQTQHAAEWEKYMKIAETSWSQVVIPTFCELAETYIDETCELVIDEGGVTLCLSVK